MNRFLLTLWCFALVEMLSAQPLHGSEAWLNLMGGNVRKGGKINGLTHLCGRFRWVVVDAGREVLDCHDFMFVWTGQEGLCERDDIQPLIPRKPKQPVVQVESVDIHDSLFHHYLSERQGPDFRPALHRIAEAQRSVSNPSRGSARIVPNRISRNKWGNSFSRISRFGGFSYGVHIFVGLLGMLDLSKYEKATISYGTDMDYGHVLRERFCAFCKAEEVR